MKWKIDTRLQRSGGGVADDEHVGGFTAPDWECWLTTTTSPRHHLLIQFSRRDIDRKAAEEIVSRILAGLNAEAAS